MAKYGNKFYLQLTREIFSDKYKELSTGAKWLFVVLNELEHKYASGSADAESFLRSDKKLAQDAGLSLSTLKRCKEELRKTDLVSIGIGHWITDKKTGKLSEKKETSYTIRK